MPNHWNPDEVDYLRCNAGTQTYAEIASMLGRSASSVQTKAQRIGVATRLFWTGEELACLREHYGKVSAVDLALWLGRTVLAVHQQAAKLRLVRHRSALTPAIATTIRRRVAAGWCNRHIGREVKAHRKTIRDWRRQLGLPDVDSGGSVDSCPRCKEQTRRNTDAQLRHAGLRSMGELRVQAFAKRALAAGWPAWCRPREVQMLAALEQNGPMTRRQLAEAIGMPWLGSRKSLRCTGAGVATWPTYWPAVWWFGRAGYTGRGTSTKPITPWRWMPGSEQRRDIQVMNESIGEWMQRLRAAAVKSVSEDDIVEIFEAIKRRAKQGDLAAVKLLLAYTTGEAQRPQIAVQVNNRLAGPHARKVARRVEALEHQRNGASEGGIHGGED